MLQPALAGMSGFFVEATVIERYADLLVFSIGEDPQQYLAMPESVCKNRHSNHIVYVDQDARSVRIFCPDCETVTARDLKPRKTIEELLGSCPFDPSEATARRRKSGATTHAWYRSRGW